MSNASDRQNPQKNSQRKLPSLLQVAESAQNLRKKTVTRRNLTLDAFDGFDTLSTRSAQKKSEGLTRHPVRIEGNEVGRTSTMSRWANSY